jgi:hypothetical protein
MTARALAAFLGLLAGAVLACGQTFETQTWDSQTWDIETWDTQSKDTQAPGSQGSDPQSSGANLKPAADVGPKSPQWSGLSVEDKLRYDGRHFFDVENFVFAGVGAALDQWRDRPSEWGEGWGAFGERYASHIGQYAIQRSIMFPVQAIDHEDARYFRSKRTSYRGRIGDAFLHTIWRPSDTGEMMPAYSEFLGDYGAAAVSRMWWPERFHHGSAIFVAGSDTLLVDAGINVLHEFAPDLKRWLHMGHP